MGGMNPSAWQRVNENSLQSLEDKCHRMLNAVEPGTVVAIHRRVAKDECFVVLRGKVRVSTRNDEGSIIEDVGVRKESGNYGVDVSGFKEVLRRKGSME